MKFKNKSIFALFVIFILAMSVATIYAENASVGSLSFEVPSDLKIVDKNDTGITFNNDDGDKIIIDENINTGDVANAYLQSEGYSFDTSFNVNRTTYSPSGSTTAAFSYQLLQYSGNNGYALVYVFNKDGADHTIIAFTDSIDAAGGPMSDSVDGVDDLIDAIMK
ncbi:MAG: hypothetical protein IJF83_13350 [Methanobrevibacter sp.]|nr:hypothetical protein [Methanobrevibacter sp.]